MFFFLFFFSNTELLISPLEFMETIVATSSVYVTTNILRKHNIDNHGHTLSTTLIEEQDKDKECGTTTMTDVETNDESKGKGEFLFFYLLYGKF